MGFYENNNGVLSPIAGRGKAEYGASTVRTGTFNIQMNVTDSTYDLAVTFSTPMPDNDYLVDFTCHNQHGSVCILNGTKTANGFTARASCVDSSAVGETMLVEYTAFKLYTDTEYNGLLNNQRYSTSEIDTGKTWIDGYKIYRKVIALNMPNNNTSTTAHGISNLRTVVSLTGILTSGSYIMPLPVTHNDNLRVVMNLHGNDIELTSEGDYSQSSGFAVIEYTKTS